MPTKKSIAIFAMTLLSILTLIKVFGPPKADVMHAIQELAIKMRKQPFGKVLMCCLIIITGIPPLFGYTFAVSLTGFIYGFPGACLPATIGGFMSAMITFGLIRRLNFFKSVQLSEKRQTLLIAMQDAIIQGGFKMTLLIRICPIPWQLTNLLLSSVPNVTTKSYLLSALVASLKFNMEAWVGSQFAELSNPNLPSETHRVTLIYMGIGLFVLFSSGFWLYRSTMHKIKEQQEKLLSMDDNERQRLIVRNQDAPVKKTSLSIV